MHITLPRARLYLFATAPLVSLVLFSYLTSTVRGVSTSVVISEVQIAGAGSGHADDEFVELYNTSNSPVNLAKWRLTRETINGATASANLVASLSGTIAPHSFYLITSKTASASPSADLLYSTGSNIGSNNTVVLYSDAGVTVVDKVGVGSASDVETTAATAPANGQSIERKACTNSTVASMGIDGLDSASGNSLDTDNNSLDFIVRPVPEPQNTLSSPETDPCGTNPTPTPTPTITPTPSPIPTIEPTLIPSPTPTPTPLPTPTVTPSPTPIPTPEPTVTPTATPTTLPSPSPSSVPSPTPIPTVPPIDGSHRPDDYSFVIGKYTCDVTFHSKRFGKLRIWVPEVECHRTQRKSQWYWWWDHNRHDWD